MIFLSVKVDFFGHIILICRCRFFQNPTSSYSYIDFNLFRLLYYTFSNHNHDELQYIESVLFISYFSKILLHFKKLQSQSISQNRHRTKRHRKSRYHRIQFWSIEKCIKYSSGKWNSQYVIKECPK